MIAEYIDKEEALDEIDQWLEDGYEDPNGEGNQALRLARKYIRKLPAADVRENVKGEWKPLDPGFYGDEVWECSACGEPWYLEAGTPKENNMNFCPRCGAQMGGAVDG